MVDTYGSVRTIGKKRRVKRDPNTGVVDSWVNPDITDAGDSFCDKLGVSKDQMFDTRKTTDTSKNPSITDDLSEPIYDLDKVKDNDPNTKFGEYCIGDNDALLRTIPDWYNRLG